MYAYNGIKNKDENNCFINSLLQSFAHLAPVREFLLSKTYKHKCNSPCLPCEITTVLVGILYSSSSISSTSIRAALVHVSNSSTFFYQERACVIEAYEFILKYYHSLHIEDIILSLTDTMIEKNKNKVDVMEDDIQIVENKNYTNEYDICIEENKDYVNVKEKDIFIEENKNKVDVSEGYDDKDTKNKKNNDEIGVNEEDCGGNCFGHQNFGFITKMMGRSCCSGEYCQDNILSSLNVCGENFVKHFKAFGEESGLENVLSSVVEAESSNSFYKKCTCGEKYLVKRFISTFPKILTISILWNDPNLKNSHIFLPIINSQINLSKILPCTESNSNCIYHFKGFIFFSRFFKHYMSVFFDESKMEWTYFSDSKTISSKHWKLVVTGLKIFQVTPAMLFYERG
ncbi:hypothetical protein SteCoe_10982 [Stentor coeruleus]|uniref:USP domain-containing protein n=1 Tax=Stentor coeruleus TaxID=5963 RepID=A0A1R2CE56_9CILI|nr:hypothetical protein SteCoe_10982 [Stentor coeruleus]